MNSKVKILASSVLITLCCEASALADEAKDVQIAEQKSGELDQAIAVFNRIFTRKLADNKTVGVRVGPAARDRYLQFSTLLRQDDKTATMVVTRHDSSSPNDRTLLISLKHDGHKLNLDVKTDAGYEIERFDVKILSPDKMTWQHSFSAPYHNAYTSGHWYVEFASHNISVDDDGRTRYSMKVATYKINDDYIAGHYTISSQSPGRQVLLDKTTGKLLNFTPSSIIDLVKAAQAMPANAPLVQDMDWRQMDY